jgi:hypothetical protein
MMIGTTGLRIDQAEMLRKFMFLAAVSLFDHFDVHYFAR